ncbi:MAG: hypothetical protein WBM44_30135 [Waterburya sp.]
MVSKNKKVLGEILQQAGLISNSQIQVALVDREYNQELRLGEILAIRGWIEQQTADFFADEWQFVLEQQAKYPLGYYLEKSGLLTKEQTHSILQEQKKIWVKFGSVAVLKGLLDQNTLDFFLDSLFPLASSQSPFISKPIQKINNLAKVENKITDKLTTSKIDYDDIPWID